MIIKQNRRRTIRPATLIEAVAVAYNLLGVPAETGTWEEQQQQQAKWQRRAATTAARSLWQETCTE